MSVEATEGGRVRALYDLSSDANAVWGGAYDGDLHGAFARLRETGPVHPGSVSELLGRPLPLALGGGARIYSCFDWETVDTALRDNVTYSSEVYKGLPIFGPNILEMVGEEHRRMRAVAQPAFTRRAAQWWIDRWIAPTVDELVSRFEHAGRADLNLEFCALVPLMLTTRSFGLSDGDPVAWRELIESMIRPDDPDGRMRASAEIAERLAPVIAEHRRDPSDDLLSVFTQGTLVDGDGTSRPLSEDEVLGYCRLLLAAGTGTTWRQLGITLFALLSDPDQLAAVQADRSLLRNAIEESVRWEVTDTTFRRLVTRDVVLGGTPIPAGTVLEMCLSAANRDPSRWDDPDVYDLRRPLLPHSGFAGGPHVCLGLHVARAEMTEAIGALLDRLPGMRLDAAAPPPRIVGQEHRGPTALPVVFA